MFTNPNKNEEKLGKIEHDPAKAARRLAVIGIGNPLMGDDAAGIIVLQGLRKADLPPDTELIDGGTGGLSLLHTLSKYDAVVIADAVDMGLQAGQVRVFSPNDVVAIRGPQRLSAHEEDFLEVVRLVDQLDESPPKIRICAIQPKQIDPNVHLAKEVQEALPQFTRTISLELWNLRRDFQE